MFLRLVSADWSKKREKRWRVTASQVDQRWRVGTPVQVGDCAEFVRDLISSEHGPTLAGFDFPIGFPETFGQRSGLGSFRSALNHLGKGAWSEFYNVAHEEDEICLSRPFYPYAPGGKKKAHLIHRLGLATPDDLLRRCERATTERKGACALFWTLGANQVGRAAISGWKEVVSPALQHQAALWPFDGSLCDLERKTLVIAEIYPADAYSLLNIKLGRGGKRSTQNRREQAKKIMDWARAHFVDFDISIVELINNGFAKLRENGEDPFDALLGLLGMIEVVGGRRPEGAIDELAVRKWEGWILGRL